MRPSNTLGHRSFVAAIVRDEVLINYQNVVKPCPRFGREHILPVTTIGVDAGSESKLSATCFHSFVHMDQSIPGGSVLVAMIFSAISIAAAAVSRVLRASLVPRTTPANSRYNSR